MTMLETIREYAGERLEASGERAEIANRHAAFFLELAKGAAGHHGPEQQQWLDALDQELDNFRAVIRGAIESGEAVTGLRLAAALTIFWLFRNHWKEGRRHLEELLSLPASRDVPAARAAGLTAATELMSWQADYDAVLPLADEALAIHGELGDVLGVASQLGSLGYANIVADTPAALKLFRESLEAYRQAGGPPVMVGALIGMAVAEMRLGNVSEGTKFLEDAEELLRQAGDDEFLFVPMGLLGVADRLQGDLAAARRRYVEVLVRSQEGGRHLGTTMALDGLADLALLQRQPEEAAVLAAAEARLAEELGGTPSLELAGIPEVLERARAELVDERYEAAVARGRSAPLEEIVHLALSRASENPGSD